MSGGYRIGQLRVMPIWQPRPLGESTLKRQAQESKLGAPLVTALFCYRCLKESWVFEMLLIWRISSTQGVNLCFLGVGGQDDEKKEGNCTFFARMPLSDFG